MTVPPIKELISALFDIGKLPSKVVALVLIVSGIILFCPPALHDKLHTRKLLEDGGPYVGLALLVSAGLLMLNILIWLFGFVARAWARARLRLALAQEVIRLDHAQISVLREFYLQGRQNISLPVDQPTVAGLLKNGILYSVSTLGRRSMAGVLYPLEITTECKCVLLRKHLGLPDGEPTPEELKLLLSERPPFMREVEKMEGERNGLPY